MAQGDELASWCAGAELGAVRKARRAAGVLPSFKRVDTCAAEFEAATPYMYSSYDGNDECESTSERKVSPSLLCSTSGFVLAGRSNQLGLLLPDCQGPCISMCDGCARLLRTTVSTQRDCALYLLSGGVVPYQGVE